MKEQLRRIPNKGLGFGVLYYLGQDERFQGIPPHSSLVFNYLGQFGESGRGETLLNWVNEGHGSDIGVGRERTHKLGINGQVTAGCLQFSFDYNRNHYREETIQALAEMYFSWLEDIVGHCLEAEGGFTPSDFPLAQVSISRLDKLQQEYALEALYPSTPMQQGLLLETELSATGGAYMCQLQVVFENVNPQALKQAWQRLVERHGIFRTAFVEGEDGHQLQLVHTEVELPWRELDWHELDAQTQATKRAAEVSIERHQAFAIDRAPLMRFLLIKESERQHRLVWTHHHALLDAWSLSLVVDDLSRLYDAITGTGIASDLSEPVSYQHYIRWLANQDRERTEAYWRDYLAGCEPMPLPVGLHSDRGNTAQEAFHEDHVNRHGEYMLNVSLEVTAHLEELAKQAKVTVNTVFQCAWGLLLSRYANSQEAIFGVTHSGRPAELPQSERMVGLFINTRPLRLEIPSDNPSLKAWLQRVHRSQLQQEPYGHVGLEDIQRWAGYGPTEPLFDTLMVYENTPAPTAVVDNPLPLLGVEGEEEVHYPLGLVVHPGETLSCKLMYQKSRLEASAVERLAGHLKQVLKAMAGCCDQPVKQLSLLSSAEEQQLHQWNQTQSDYPQDQCIHELFAAQVQRTPDATAVICAEQGLSYQELNEQANQLAHYLVEQGVRPETLVGVCLERSLAMMVAILGILKAGGAYVPLDPDYPENRLAFMLDDCEASIVVSEQSSLKRHPALGKGREVICLNDTGNDLHKYSNHDLEVNVNARNLAYVIYTSGSTGEPKGTMIEHRGVINLVTFQRSHLQIDSSSKILQYASISFDASVWEMFSALLNGVQLHIVPSQLRGDAKAFIDYMNQSQISHATLPPAFLECLAKADLIYLKTLIVAGDKCDERTMRYWSMGRRLINAYGPTEVTVCGSTRVYESGDSPCNIGQAIHNTSLYILDHHQCLVPFGIPGELYIGGDGVARGYLNRSDLTGAKFIKNPFGPGRLYRTGDLVRRLPDGDLLFIGRADDQVKIRGFRIELGEIEAALVEEDCVREARVMVHHQQKQEQRDTRLVAYVLADEESISIETLRRALKQRLPDYMIPATFIYLDAWPLTPNGKIDKKALPEPNMALLSSEYVAPDSETEIKLTRIWAELLEVDEGSLSVTANFFDMGGHSLLATRLVNLIAREFEIKSR